MRAFIRIYSDEWKSWVRTHRSLLPLQQHVHTSRAHRASVRPSVCLSVCLSASLRNSRASSAFSTHDLGEMRWPDLPMRYIGLTLRLGEPQHVHGTSKRENDFIMWRTVAFERPLATWRNTGPRALSVLFSLFSLQFATDVSLDWRFYCVCSLYGHSTHAK